MTAPGRTPRRILATIAALLVGAALAAGSFSVFTSRAAHPDNRFAAGTLAVSDSADGDAVLTASGMRPGDKAGGVVDIANTGSVTGTLTLSRPQLEDSDDDNPLSTQLNLTVSDCGSFAAGTPICETSDPVVFAGTLADMSGTSALGTYSPDEQHRYRFKLALDPGAGNAYQGDTSTATFRWDAIQ